MSSDSLNSTPLTPFPDAPNPAGQQSDSITGESVESPLSSKMVKPTTSSADDLSLLLAQASPDPYLAEGEIEPASDQPGKPRSDIDGPEPGAFVGSLSSSENELDIRFSPLPDQRSTSLPATSPSAGSQQPDEEPEPRISWPFLLVSSYASALTLTLCFVLWTGRGLWRADHGSSSEPPGGPNGRLSGRNAGSVGKAPLPLPAPNVTILGKPLRVGELQVTPLAVTCRPVNLLRLEGTADGERETAPVLVMTLELRNLSATDEFAPLDPALVRDPVPAIDQSFVELPGGRRIAMFRLAIESEWSIEDQFFPNLKPGETAETIVVSEPVALAELAGTVTWHVKLRTAPYRTDVLGAQFSTHDVVDSSF